MNSDSETAESAPRIVTDDSSSSTGPTDTSSGGSTSINTIMVVFDYTGEYTHLVVTVVVGYNMDVPSEGYPVPIMEPDLVP